MIRLELQDCESRIQELLSRERTPEVARALREWTERWGRLLAVRQVQARAAPREVIRRAG